MNETDRGTHRLVRRTDNKWIAGVCSGLGDYFGVDPLLFRIGFVLLGLMGLTGILLYVLAWVLIPASGDRPRSGRRAWGDRPSIGIALLVLGALLLAPMFLGMVVAFLNAGRYFDFGPFDFYSLAPEPLVLAGLLILIGVVLLSRREATATADQDAAALAADGAETRTPPAAPSVAPRERSALTAFTLAAMLLVVGGAALLSNVGLVALDVGQLTALSLLIIGAGLIVGAWYGRARILIALGILIMPIVLVTSLIDFPLSGGIGNRYVAPTSSREIEDMSYTVGQVHLDLTRYDFPATTEEVDIELGAGEVMVYVPRDAFVEVNLRARAGEAFVFSSHDGGFDVNIDRVAGPLDSDKRLTLNIEAGFGSFNVFRVDDDRRRPRRIPGKRGHRNDPPPGDRRKG